MIINNNELKSELNIIEELKNIFEPSNNYIGIGDDAAVLEHNILVSTDAMVEGVHFLRSEASWDDVAYKLFASNASDIAAMGGYPTAYTLTLSLPHYWTNQDHKMFLSGIKDFLQEFPADLIGGDLVRSKEFFASVTVLGKSVSTPCLRSTAKEGDFIYCTGTLGDSRLWLNKIVQKNTLPILDEDYFKKRHYRPTPRIEWIQTLKRFPLNSLMDISDGLVEDLQKLCRASKKSFYIDGDPIPLSEEAIGINNLKEHKSYYQKEALIGGEDYELLFTSPEIINEAELLKENIKISRIGRILPLQEQSFISLQGKQHKASEFKGFEH